MVQARLRAPAGEPEGALVLVESPIGHAIDPRFVLELRAWLADVVGAVA